MPIGLRSSLNKRMLECHDRDKLEKAFMDTPRTSTDTTTAGSPKPSAASAPDLQSTGIMKALVLVDDLREQRKTADDERLAALMRRR